MPTAQSQSNPTLFASSNPQSRAPVRRVDISHFDDLPDDAMVPIKTLAALIDKGESTIWRNCQEVPDFPKPIRLGPCCTRFKVGDIRAYLAAKASASTMPKRKQRRKGQVAA